MINRGDVVAENWPHKPEDAGATPAPATRLLPSAETRSSPGPDIPLAAPGIFIPGPKWHDPFEMDSTN